MNRFLQSAVLPFAIAIFSGCAGAGISRDPASDSYPDYASLAAENRRGIDFEILSQAIGSGKLAFAIHGGEIEEGTAELAQAIAENDFDFYAFLGRGQKALRMHLTSTRFDEPELMRMLETAEDCMSLHGLEAETTDFCIGGANETGRADVLRILQNEFPEATSCELCCAPNDGTSLRNVVNRCLRPGVQIELGSAVRARLLSDPTFRERVAEALRGALARGFNP